MQDKFHADIIDVNRQLFLKYQYIVESSNIDSFGTVNKEYLIQFCRKAVCGKFTIDKHSRWLGFIQGILFCNGLLDLEKERAISREMFQEVYIKHGIKQETISAIWR